MARMKLNSGMVWKGSPVPAGEIIDCTDKETQWLQQRGKAVLIVEKVIIPAQIVEKPERKKPGPKPKSKSIQKED